MALQGTIETFALPDVLRLLASTKKTGQLRLTGDRGAGNIWVSDGAIVGGDVDAAPHADGATDLVFELLRFDQGEFTFDDGPAPDGGPATDVEPTLQDAEKLLAEWRLIAEVVPSGDAWVSLAEQLPGDEITIGSERWTAIVAVAGGVSVNQLGDKLTLGELPVARLVKDLKDEGLIDIGDAPAGAATAVSSTPTAVPETPAPAVEEPAPTPEPAAAPEPAAFEPASFEPEPVAAPEPEPFPAGDSFDPNALVIEGGQGGGAGAAAAPVVEPPAEVAEAPGGGDLASKLASAEPGEAAEIARQLANLSPKAARAVAAAAKATTEEERNAALAEVEEGDDQINRDLLLKFLGPSS